MARQELIKELQIREKELMDELEAIKRILRSNTTQNSDGVEEISIMKRTKFPVSEKAKRSWEDYIIDVLAKIGGKGKSIDVTEVIAKANPKIKEDTVSHAVRHHLSKLLKDEKIGANKSKIKSEGYEYFVK